MKIRQSFVSNSSSTSYVVLFPEGATADDLELKNLEGAVAEMQDSEGTDEEEAKKDLLEGLSRLLGGSSISDYDDGALVNVLPDLLDDYVIASMESGPDAGCVMVAQSAKVKKILLGGGDED